MTRNIYVRKLKEKMREEKMSLKTECDKSTIKCNGEDCYVLCYGRWVRFIPTYPPENDIILLDEGLDLHG